MLPSTCTRRCQGTEIRAVGQLNDSSSVISILFERFAPRVHVLQPGNNPQKPTWEARWRADGLTKNTTCVAHFSNSPIEQRFARKHDSKKAVELVCAPRGLHSRGRSCVSQLRPLLYVGIRRTPIKIGGFYMPNAIHKLPSKAR